MKKYECEPCGYVYEDVYKRQGVTIGEGAVIGAGSVVSRDVPPGVLAAGNPCRVIRAITGEDRDYYWRNSRFDVTDYGRPTRQ